MKKIKVCTNCLTEDFLISDDNTLICKNCKEIYVFDKNKKEWKKTKDTPDQKQFINESSS